MLRVREALGVGGFFEGAGTPRYVGATADPVAATTMTRIVVVAPTRFVVRPSATNNLQVWWENARVNTAGWRMYWHDNLSQARFVVADGGGVGRTCSVSLELPPYPKLVVFAGAYDNVTIIGRTSENQTGSQPCVGITASVQAAEVGIRDTQNNQASLNWAVLACLGTNLVARTDPQLAADIATIQDNLEQGRDLRQGLAWSPQAYLDGRDVADVQPPRATWVDRASGLALTRGGLPSAFAFPARF